MTHDIRETTGTVSTRERATTRVKPYGDRAAEQAAEASRRTHELRERAAAWHPPLAPIGAGLLLLLGIVTFVAVPALNLPYTGAAWNTSLRDEGIAVIVALAGARLCVRSGAKVAALVALVCGLAMVAFGTWLPHSAPRGTIMEIALGAAISVSAVIALAPASTRAP